MARQRGHSERKRRTREHILADLSANFVEKQALLCGFAVERVRFDYGIDLVIQTFNPRGEVESGRILCQLKATERIRTLASDKSVSCRIEQADLAHSLEEPSPVLLVLYDAKKDVGYWIYVQSYFSHLAGFDLANCGRRVTVLLPRSNILNRKALKRVARAKNSAAATFRRVWPHDL